jgi:hypothetical protein
METAMEISPTQFALRQEAIRRWIALAKDRHDLEGVKAGMWALTELADLVYGRRKTSSY